MVGAVSIECDDERIDDHDHPARNGCDSRSIGAKSARCWQALG